MKIPSIIIVGKPNVGKSTLFNTLLKSKEAIVGEEYGLTRDYQKLICKIDEIKFFLIDTAGLSEDKNIYREKLLKFTKEQINQADIVFFLVDSSQNLTNDDLYCSKVLRKIGKKIILLENKAELKSSSNFGNQGFSLGHGIPIKITAKNRRCSEVIKNEIKKNINFIDEEIDLNKQKKNFIRICLAGRPNTGKSTLFNLINERERVITGEQSGTTRDSVITEIIYKQNKINIIDTAGIKKNRKIDTITDKSATYYSRKEIRYANIVILVFDATMPFSNQDLTITNYIIKEGRSILLIFNKWDLVSNKEKIKKNILDSINVRLFDIKGVNCLFLSALEKKNKNQILDGILNVNKVWNTKINTSLLNNWLRNEFIDISKNDYRGSLKIKYISQIKIRPPSFLIFCNNKRKISNTFKRNFENKLRNKFHLFGTPLRFIFSNSKNPFAKKSNN